MPNMMEKGTFESLVVVFDVKQAFSNFRVCGKKRNTLFGQCDVTKIPSLLSNETITGPL